MDPYLRSLSKRKIMVNTLPLLTSRILRILKRHGVRIFMFIFRARDAGKYLENKRLLVNYCEDPKKNEARKE